MSRASKSIIYKYTLTQFGLYFMCHNWPHSEMNLSRSSKALRSEIFALPLLHRPTRLEIINILEVECSALILAVQPHGFFSPQMIASRSSLTTVFRRPFESEKDNICSPKVLVKSLVGMRLELIKRERRTNHHHTKLDSRFVVLINFRDTIMVFVCSAPIDV